MPLAVVYVDHNMLQIDERNTDDHHYLQSVLRPGAGTPGPATASATRSTSSASLARRSSSSARTATRPTAGAAGMLAIAPAASTSRGDGGPAVLLASRTVVGVELARPAAAVGAGKE